MTSLLIENCRLYNACETAPPCGVLVRDGVIEQIGAVDARDGADRVVDAQGRILAPGFIDVHIQGAGGADVLDATVEALETISRNCARFGVTSFLATTVYKPGQDNRPLKVAAECLGQDLGGAGLLGVHLEGPFISAEKRGMIQPDCLAGPARSVLAEIEGLLGDHLTMMTIAPELPENLSIVKDLVARGVIASLGHTQATYEETLAGFEAGISHVTHLFNAMPSLYHRSPGPLAAIFERQEVTAQVIADGAHIHPSMIRLAFSCLGPERFVTITDGIQAMGLPDGSYVYNGVDYEAKEGTARYRDGTLIGTALGLNQMAARLVQFTGCSVPLAIQTVSENPARVLGLEEKKGFVRVGYDADLVLLEADLSVHTAVVGGKVVYEQ
ncbi:MAG: N-acetylglucosamine-6-phosphate deacetylase [Planctomycetota bacterium]|jgi:N-acetylglucosamine-6-phosphate deacetylase